MRVDRVSPQGSPPEVQRPQSGDGLKILAACQIVIDVAFAIFTLLIKAQGIGFMPIGATTLGVFTSKAILKAIEIKWDKDEKNGAQKASDYLFWIMIITNLALGALVFVGRENAFLFSAISCGLSGGTKLITVITKLTLGKQEERLSCFQ